MDKDVASMLEQFSALPRFPDGRIDFSTAREAPVINVFVMHEECFLLLKRSKKVGTYQECWNAVAGYLDEPVSLEEKSLEELREELGIERSMVASIGFATPIIIDDDALPKKWLVHPVMVELKERIIPRLDWEHTAYAWVIPKDFKKYRLVKGLERVYARIRHELLP